MYNSSIPILQRYLSQLTGMLVQAQEHLTVNETDFLRSRLAPDMFPLWQQVLITISFSLRASAPLAGCSKPQIDFHEKSFNQLHHDIQEAQKFLNQLTPEQFTANADAIIYHQAGQAVHEMPSSVYLQHYALPNFFFHLTCVYAILRQQGVPLGKSDFDGFHQYN